MRGGTGGTGPGGPQKVLNKNYVASSDARDTRYKFLTLRRRLDNVAVRTAALPALPQPAGQTSDIQWCHLADALAKWRELDLSPEFSRYARSVDSRALSLPVLYLHRIDLVKETLGALGQTFSHALADCLLAIARDLDAGFLPFWTDTLRALVTPLIHSSNDSHKLWDIDQVILPVLAVLGRIAQIIGPMAVNHPDTRTQTIVILAPLIVHRTPRFRQLMAESFTGLFLRLAIQSTPTSPQTNVLPKRIPTHIDSSADSDDEEFRPNFEAAVPWLKGLIIDNDESFNHAESLYEACRGFQGTIHMCAPYLLRCLFSMEKIPAARVLGPLSDRLTDYLTTSSSDVAVLLAELLDALDNASRRSNTEILSLWRAMLPMVSQLAQHQPKSDTLDRVTAKFKPYLVQATQEPVIDVIAALLMEAGHCRNPANKRLWETRCAGIHTTLVDVAAKDDKMVSVHSLMRAFPLPHSLATRVTIMKLCELCEDAGEMLTLWAKCFAPTCDDLVKGSYNLTRAPVIAGAIIAGLRATHHHIWLAVLCSSCVDLGDDVKVLQNWLETAPQGPIRDFAVLACATQLRQKNMHRTDSGHQLRSACMTRLKHQSTSVPLLCGLLAVATDKVPQEIREILCANLANPNQTVRILSFRILATSLDGRQLEIFRLCEYAVVAGNDIYSTDCSRLKITQAATLINGVEDLEEWFLRTLSFLVIGLFRTPLATIWPVASALWAALAGKERKVAWGVMKDTLSLSLNQLGLAAGSQTGIVTAKSTKRPRRAPLPIGINCDEIRGDELLSPEAFWSIGIRTTDNVSLHIQLINCIADHPDFGRRDAGFILGTVFVEFCNRHSLTLPKKRFEAVLLGYGNLLESYGGLRCLPSKDKTLDASVRDALLRMLGRTEGSCQVVIVRCLTKSRAKLLEPYRDNLLRLADESAFRDELTLFASRLSKEPEQELDDVTRAELVEVVLRILLGKASTKGGSQSARRFAIVGFFESVLNQTELTKAVELFIEPLSLSKDHRIAAKTSVKLQEGVLSSIGALAEGLSSAFNEEAWIHLCRAILSILRASFDPKLPTYSGRKNLRSLSCQRMTGILQRREVDDRIMRATFETISFAFESIDISGDQSPALLLLVAECCQHSSARDMLCADFGQIVDRCLTMLRTNDVLKARSGIDPLLIVAESILCFLKSDSGRAMDLGTSLMGAIQVQLKTIIVTFWSSVRTSIPTERWTMATRMLLLAQATADTCLTSSNISNILVAGFPSRKLKLPKILDGASFIFVDQFFATLGVALEVSSATLTDDARRALLRVICQMIGNRTWCIPLRSSLVRVLAAFDDPHLEFARPFLSDTVAMRTDRVDEGDYDKRISAFRRVSETRCWSVSEDSFLIVALQCLSSLHESDASCRGAAGHALCTLGKYIGADTAYLAAADILMSDVLSALVECQTTEVRREIGRVLGCTLRSFLESSSELPEVLRPLLVFHRQDNDIEADFFENIAHIQRHRRSRSLRRLASELSEKGDHHCATAFTFSYPLALSIIREETEILQQATIMGASDDLIPAAIAVCGAAASRMSWPQYRKTVSSLLKMVRNMKKDESAKSRHSFNAIQKVILTVVDAFQVGAMDEHYSTAYLKDQLIPSVASLILQEDPDGLESPIFRAPMAVGAGRLLMYLPEDTRESLITTLVNPVCNVMGSRNGNLRDKARGAMVALVTTFGAKYFAYLVGEVCGFLSEGFRKHVRGYSIHAMLAAVDFSIDFSATQIILRTILDEIRGSVAQEKSVEGLHNNVREAASNKGGDMMELVGRRVVFEETISTFVLDTIADASDIVTDRKVLRKLQELLRRLSQGLSSNSSVSKVDALRFVHYVLSKQLPLCRRPSQSDGGLKYSSNAGVIAEFGVDFLYILMARSFFGSPIDDMEVLSMLDPLLVLIAECGLDTSRTTLTLKSLRLTQRLMRLPLPSRLKQSEHITKTVLDVLTSPSSGAGASGELFNACLRAASAVLQDDEGLEVRINEGRAEALLLVARPPILDTSGSDLDTRLAAVSLIRTVIARKIVIPQVYDAVDAVARLGIQSQAKPLRDLCASVSLSFMLHYPLSSKRLHQHLDFYLRNLDFEYADGRLASLTALAAVMAKFPLNVIEEESEYLFVPIMAKAVGDSEGSVRTLAADTVKKLFQRLSSSQKLSSLTQMLVEWISGVSVDVRVLGISGLGVLAESGSMKKRGGRDFVDLVISRGISLGNSQWKLCHSAMLALENIFTSDRSLTSSSVLQDFWESHISQLLLHAHPWIRHSSSRVLGMHLSSISEQTSSPGEFGVYDVPGLAREILKSTCRQLEAVDLVFSHAEQVGKNIVALAAAIKNTPSFGSYLGNIENGDSDGDQPGGCSKNKPLQWLVRRVAGIASRKPAAIKPVTIAIRRLCGLRVIEELITRFGTEFMVERYFGILVACLYQILESNSVEMAVTEAEEGNGSLKDLAGSIQDILSGACGTRYFEEYNSCRSAKLAARAERKRKRAVDAVTRPEVAALRKSRKNLHKRSKRSEEIAARREKRGHRRVTKATAN